MTYKLESAAKELADAISTLKQDALAEARESLLGDPQALLKELFSESLYLHVNGIGYRGPKDLPPFTVYLRDIDAGVLLTFDPVADVIENIRNDNMPEDDAQEMIARSITTLQIGIDRLRAYEAERLKAQS